jgi:NTP pyrophosphatase (non-canonical NTP hydrolase)
MLLRVMCFSRGVFCAVYSRIMQFDDLRQRAIEVRDKYDELNQAKRGVIWNEQQLMAGFVGDVGDLSKIIMAKHGLRAMDDVDAKLAHELSDCLWVVIVLASKYDIDLAKAFMKTMDELDKRIDADLAA